MVRPGVSPFFFFLILFFFPEEGCFPGNNVSSWLPVVLLRIFGGPWRKKKASCCIPQGRGKRRSC